MVFRIMPDNEKQQESGILNEIKASKTKVNRG